MPKGVYKGRHRGYKIVENGCWEYLGAGDKDGYAAQIQENGKTLRGQRYYYEKYKGKIPKGLQIDHLCKNRICVNPEHFEAVTPMENLRRRVNVKMNEEVVDRIRRIYKNQNVSQTALAKKFNINQCHVSRIVNFKRWL